MQVYVLLFNARTENEGIHTLSIGRQNIVLMFEDEDDATRYALLLEAQDFPVPTPERLDRAEIEAFCDGANYESKFVPRGFQPETELDRLLIVPPEQNLEQTSWELDQQAGSGAASNPSEDEGEFSSNELDQIRKRLEGLL